MIIIEPTTTMLYQDQVRWCRETFGPASKTMNWSTVIPENMVAFKDEKLALLYLLKFGGVVTNQLDNALDYPTRLYLGHYVSPIHSISPTKNLAHIERAE